MQFTTPVGRLVQGSVYEQQTKDNQGNLRVIKTGPNAGQPNPQYFIALAFAKNDPAWPAFEAAIKGAAAGFWPLLFPGGVCTRPNFSFKIIDGDGYDDNGNNNAEKPGFAGHWVVRFTRTAAFGPIRCFEPGKYAPEQVIQNPDRIKRGHYGRVSGTVSSNKNDQKPGIYLNIDMFEHSGYGPEIVSGRSASDAFGAAPAALPAGASATPVAPVPAPVPVPVPVPAPAPAPAPYEGYMAPPPAPLPARQMLPAAGGMSYEQFVAAGWSDAQLVANGMMAA